MGLHTIYLFLCLFVVLTTLKGQSSPEELRGIWIATVDNIDWPSAPGLPSEVHQQELIDYLEVIVDLNMNSVFFQIRPVGDAFYDSDIEPWSVYLTGEQGKPPEPLWDPLQFLIAEAHQRGIEVHGWINPYRANLTPDWEGLAPNHMANLYPEYAYPYGSYLWMDPGAAVVTDHLMEVILDIVERYDIDGIHLDDYFYPYPEEYDFPDQQTYQDYQDEGGEMELDDWRRDNVNRMINRLYVTVKETDRKVKVTISPIGVYRPGEEGGMPEHICCYDPYESQYADSKLWLEEGWLDIFIPQIYWSITSSNYPYADILDWWLYQNPKGRHITAGNAAYRCVTSDWPLEELHVQVNISRTWRDRLSMGNVFYSAKYFLNNVKGMTDYFKANIYQEPARIPELPWLED